MVFKTLIILACISFLCYISTCFRIALSHPISTLYYAVKDTIMYFAYNKKWIYNGGLLNCYFAHFGGGKTLSLAQYAVRLYKRYNNRRIYDTKKKKWITQKVYILSNVELMTVPFKPLHNLNDIVDMAKIAKDIDENTEYRAVVIVLIDEASKELNSREFKHNFNADTLDSLLCCRHVHMSIFYTSQKFKLVDALLRSVTQKCIWCNKVWRFMVQYTYNADELEYSPNPMLVKEIWRSGFFIRDKHYNQYDTLATVEKLQKEIDEGGRLTTEEILNERGMVSPDMSAVTPSRKYLKFYKRK